MKQNSICMPRVLKNLAYFIAPIFGIIFIVSLVVLSFTDTDITLKSANSYFETKSFSEKYLNNVYLNYQIVKNNIITTKEIDLENFPDIQYYGENNTNFCYLIINEKNKKAITNIEHNMKTDTIEGIKNQIQENNLHWSYENGEVKTSIEALKLENIRYYGQIEKIIKDENYTIYTSLINNLPYNDSYSTSQIAYDFVIKINNMAPVLIPISIIVLIICAIAILNGIGKVAKSQEIYLNWFDKWKLEIVLCICGFIIGIGFLFLATIESGIRTIVITGISIGSIIIYLGCILLLETIVKRIKTHTVWKTTIIYSILSKIKQLIDDRNISTKLIIFYWGFCILAFFLVAFIISNMNNYNERNCIFRNNFINCAGSNSFLVLI